MKMNTETKLTKTKGLAYTKTVLQFSLIGISLGLLHCPNPENNSCFRCGNLLIHNSDGTTGSLAAIDTGSGNVTTNIINPHQDTYLRTIDNEPYLIGRFGANHITRLNKDNYATSVFQESVVSAPPGETAAVNPNPSDIAKLENGLGLVSLQDENHLLVINLSTGVAVDTINISANTYNTEMDDAANVHAMIRHGDYIYVSIADHNNNFRTTENGKLIRIHAQNYSITSLTDMPFRFPSYGDIQHYHGNLDNTTDKDWLIIVVAGHDYPEFMGMGLREPGGLVAYDIANNSYRILLQESNLGKDIFNVWIVSDTLGFVSLADYTAPVPPAIFGSFQYSVHAFNPTGSEMRVLLADAGLVGFSQIVYKDRRLYVGNRKPNNEGIHIFDVADETDINSISEQTTGPIGVDGRPYSMILLD